MILARASQNSLSDFTPSWCSFKTFIFNFAGEHQHQFVDCAFSEMAFNLSRQKFSGFYFLCAFASLR
jgi:hypothetical protein